jgi:S1-C subfamily serine protease
MKRNLLVLSLILALPTAGAAERAADVAPEAPLAPEESMQARRELAELRAQIGDLSRKMNELSTKLGDVGPRAYAFRYLNESDRAVIGVVLSPEPRGPRISALTPDSPAERAGLRSGDIITSINGHALAAKEPEASLTKARELLGNLKNGQQVRLGYLRDGSKTSELTLKAERREALNWPRLFTGENDDVKVIVHAGDTGTVPPDLDARIAADIARAEADAARARANGDRERAVNSRWRADTQRAVADTDRHRADIVRIEASMRDAMPWWGLNLAALNDDLGRYFGSKRGVLVLSANKETLPDLKAGDVIREVAGRSVQRPEEALRALRDQPTGSEVEIAILRERKPLALKIKVPEYKSIFNIGRLAVPAGVPALPGTPTIAPPPAPPAPPAAPLTPASKRGDGSM